MLAVSLQSGSNGNCIYVEADGARLLFDAGISGIQAQRRLAAIGRDIRDVDALIISHDHIDHVRAAGIYQRKYGLAMYVTRKTLAAARARCDLGRLGAIRHFCCGDVLRFGSATVRTIRTPHDAVDGVCFVVEVGHKRLGVLTDLGHVFADLGGLIGALDGVILESNYDPDMLAAGPYPAFLKARICGPGGHISNFEAARLLARHGRRLRWACLGHMSEQNNHPELALETHRKFVGKYLPLHVATRCAASEPMQL